MSDINFADSGVPEVTRYEHVRKNVGAKNVAMRGYIPSTDQLALIAAVDNGDGTYSLKTNAGGLLPFEFDDLQFSNADGNGNYQTAVIKNDTVTVATLTLTYDGSSKLTRITRA